jgi:hypothetical protein
MKTKIKNRKPFLNILLASILIIQTGCATEQGNKIAIGMLGGAAVGALAGNSLSSDTNQNQRTRNTIISAIVFSLISGGFMAWHYRQIEETKIEISGRYARYRLCDSGELSAIDKEFEGDKEKSSVFEIAKSQVGKLSLTLDDSTKWVYPIFRKRYLMPERDENRVISERYIWEILKPGSFVTRSQNPEYFFEK